jgi:cytoskeletal protein RodZ
MKKIRSEKRLSLSEVSKSTKIQAKYLEYIEEGEYSKLPADVYVKGFLRSYANYMGLSENVLIKQFEREKGIHKNINKLEDKENSNRPVKFSTFTITPKVAIACAVALVVVLSFFYLYREVNNFISVPRLIIIKPMDGTSIDGNSVHVAGIAEKDSVVFINNQPVLVSEKGEFSEDVGLKEGLNTIAVMARSKFNKEASQTVSVNAQYHSDVDPNANAQSDVAGDPAASPADNLAGSVQAEVYVNPDSSWLSVQADGNLVYSGVLLAQSVQKFEAKQKISITSGKGNETYVKINGKDLGTISSNPGVVRDVEYDANGKVETKK